MLFPRTKCRSAVAVESLEARRLLAAPVIPDVISYRTSTGKVLMDINDDPVIDRKYFFGQRGDQLTAGDVDGNTISDLTIYRSGQWLIDFNTDGALDRQINFGTSAHIGLLGDVTADGVADLLLYERSTGIWAVDVNRDGAADTGTVPYFTLGGQAGDIPLAGDLNGDGRDETIIYRNGAWLVDYHRDGKVDLTFNLTGVPAGEARPVIINWGGEYLGRPAVVVNGTWYVDTNDDRKVDVSFNFGYAGEQPLTGSFDTANSIFVTPGGAGNGAINSPFGKIADAVNAHRPGQIIRVAAGTYAENLVAYKKDNLTLLGAGRKGTHITPASGDAIAIVLGSNTWLLNMHVAGGGRGVISLGGDIHARGISTAGVRDTGLVANSSGQPEVRKSTLDLVFSNFDQAQRGNGLVLHGDTVASIRKSTFNSNGTATDLIPGADNGRGIVISDNSVLTLRKSQVNSNFDTGFSAIGNSSVTLIESAMSRNKYGNGAMFLDNTTVNISGSSFNQNGLNRNNGDLSLGRNGIEFYDNFHGPSARVVNSVFRNNTGFGIFVASGAGMVINTNLFDNNRVGIGITGEIGHTVQATVQGNTFQVPVGAAYEAGVLFYGPKATITLGGTALSAKNTFKNFPWQHAIDISPYTAGGVYQGYPNMTLAESDNIFINCPDPIRYE